VGLKSKGLILGGICIAAVIGCGGGSSSVAGEFESPAIPEDDIPIEFQLQDGSTLFVLQSVTGGIVTGEAQMVPPPGSSDPIELFQVSGTATGSTLSMILSNDEVNGADTYTLTGSTSDTGSYQLLDGTGQDLLQEPVQTIIAMSAVLQLSRESVPSGYGSPPTGFGAIGTIGVSDPLDPSVGISFVIDSTVIGGGGGLGSVAFKPRLPGPSIVISKYANQNWAWFDAFKRVSSKNVLLATGAITSAVGGRYYFMKSTNAKIFPSEDTATLSSSSLPGPCY
jgi:hypothetical protein